MSEDKTQCIHCGTYFENDKIEAHKSQCPDKKKAAALKQIAEDLNELVHGQVSLQIESGIEGSLLVENPDEDSRY